MPTTIRSTNYTFTLNNYATSDEEKLQKMQMEGTCKSIMYGRERGKEGTPHLQGFIIFYTKKSFKQVKLLLPKAHIEKMKGTILHNRNYCAKEGDFVVHGILPCTPKEKGTKEKERWSNINALCKAGKLEELEKEHPQVWHRHYRTCKLIAADHAPTPRS